MHFGTYIWRNWVASVQTDWSRFAPRSTDSLAWVWGWRRADPGGVRRPSRESPHCSELRSANIGRHIEEDPFSTQAQDKDQGGVLYSRSGVRGAGTHCFLEGKVGSREVKSLLGVDWCGQASCRGEEAPCTIRRAPLNCSSIAEAVPEVHCLWLQWWPCGHQMGMPQWTYDPRRPHWRVDTWHHRRDRCLIIDSKVSLWWVCMVWVTLRLPLLQKQKWKL